MLEESLEKFEIKVRAPASAATPTRIDFHVARIISSIVRAMP